MPFKDRLKEMPSPLITYRQSQNMQNNFFNKSPLNAPADIAILEKSSPAIPPLDEEEYSNNVLNIGFIAEDSKFLRSDSCSERSDGFSISGVSAIHGNPKDRACFTAGFDQEFASISGMEEWPDTPQIPFGKRSFKRSKPETIWDEADELQNQCTKKKMGERNRVVTINPLKPFQQSRYVLRSRRKIGLDDESSSNDDIREILFDFEKQENGAHQQKPKTSK